MGTAATIHCVLLNADRSNECWTTAVVMTCRPVTMLRQQVLTWQRRHCGSEVELHIGNLGKQRSWSAALAIVLETLPLDVVAAGAGTSVCDQAVACYGAAARGEITAWNEGLQLSFDQISLAASAHASCFAD